MQLQELHKNEIKIHQINKITDTKTQIMQSDYKSNKLR